MSRTLRPLLLAGAALLAACEPGGARVALGADRPAGAGPALARWEGGQLTAGELEGRLREMSPALRARYADPEARADHAAAVARFELLAREAVREGLLEDPRVVAELKRTLVARLTERVHARADAAVTDAEVEALYARTRADYVRPEAVRLSHLFLALPAGAPPAEAARVQARAAALATRAQALAPGDVGGFGRLVREASEDAPSRALDGDLRFQSLTALAQAWGPALADAVRGLAPGAVAGPLRGARGLHVVMLLGRQAALDVPLADVREALAARLAESRREAAWAAYLARLEREGGLTLDREALARVRVPEDAPMVAPRGPAPGTVPAARVSGAPAETEP